MAGAGEVHADPHTTFGVPGSRAPHVWLSRGGERISTIDLTGHYLLLTGARGEKWAEAARSAADEHGGLSLDVATIGRELEDAGGHFSEAFGISRLRRNADPAGWVRGVAKRAGRRR